MTRLAERRRRGQEPEPVAETTESLLVEIRDLLKARSEDRL
jgi:hypothetical protein